MRAWLETVPRNTPRLDIGKSLDNSECSGSRQSVKQNPIHFLKMDD